MENNKCQTCSNKYICYMQMENECTYQGKYIHYRSHNVDHRTMWNPDDIVLMNTLLIPELTRLSVELKYKLYSTSIDYNLGVAKIDTREGMLYYMYYTYNHSKKSNAKWIKITEEEYEDRSARRSKINSKLNKEK